MPKRGFGIYQGKAIEARIKLASVSFNVSAVFRLKYLSSVALFD